MFSDEIILNLRANPAFQDLVEKIRQRRQSTLARIPGLNDAEERLKLCGRCLELEDLDNLFTDLLKVRHDLDAGPPQGEV